MQIPIPATNSTHGPFRKVVGETILYNWRYELLDCGHEGNRLSPADGPWAHSGPSPAARRRCEICRRLKLWAS